MPAVSGATVNGSTLWRHLDQPGAEGATYTDVYESLRQQDREDIIVFDIQKIYPNTYT